MILCAAFRVNIQRTCLGLLSSVSRAVTRQMEQTKTMLTEAVAFPWASMPHALQDRSVNTDHGCRLQMGAHSAGRWVPSSKPSLLCTGRKLLGCVSVTLSQMLKFLGTEKTSIVLTTCLCRG